MKIKLTPVTHYRAASGDTDLGTFREASEWNGMVELVNPAGQRLILAGDGFTAAIFGKVFGTEQEMELVKASPDLIAKMRQADPQPAWNGGDARDSL